jgi:hypothetical protein
MNRTITALLLCAFIIGLWILSRVALRYEPLSRLDPTFRQADMGDVSMEIRDAWLIQRSKGITQWSFNCDLLRVRSLAGGDFDRYQGAEFVGLTRGKYYKEGKQQATFAANRADYDDPTKTFTIHDKIRVTTQKGERITSDYCSWSEKQDFIRFSQGARLTSKHGWLQTPNALFEPRDRVLQCPTGGEGVIDKQRVQASALFYDMESELLQFPQTVTVDRKNVKLIGQGVEIELKTSKMHANKGHIILRIQGDDPDLELHP